MAYTSAAREVPYEQEELLDSNQPTTGGRHTGSLKTSGDQLNNNNSTKETIRKPINTNTANDHDHDHDGVDEATSAASQLALIPMHPASKNHILEAKQLPIVLGRTNLAAWWWKSCPCQHYCRLYCRPVAQNIRSLSKVMIQVDTAGRVHVVGKNPHLITITPEREDGILHANDIITIGRRDREPWMRLQVISKPTTKEHGKAPSPTRQAAAQKAQGTELVDPNSKTPTSTGNAGGTAARTNSNRSRTAAATDIVGNAVAPVADPPNINNNPSNPPEWITTTSRKRKSSTSRRTSSYSNSNPSSTKQQQQQQQRANAQKLEEAASAATIARVQRSYVWASNPQNQTFNQEEMPTRKRRRRASGGGADGSSPKKSRGRSRDGRKEGADSNEKKNGADTPTTTNGESNKSGDRHAHGVHLVFQDYQTSASLLQGTERKRKSESSINQATTRATRAHSVVVQLHHGGAPPPRAFVTDKSELRLLSKNFADALQGAMSRTSGDPHDGGKVQDAPAISEEQQETNTPQDQCIPDASELKTNESKGSKSMSEVLKRNRWALSSSEEYQSLKKELNDLPREKAVAEVTNENTTSSPKDDKKTGAHEQEETQASMLSLPQCASSSFESGQRDCISASNVMESTNVVETEEWRMARAASTTDEKKNAAGGENNVDSDSSPPTCDPIMDLKPWQDIIEEEEENGTTSSARYALASLIVAKNKDRSKGDGNRSLLWLPSLLGDDFQIETKNT